MSTTLDLVFFSFNSKDEKKRTKNDSVTTCDLQDLNSHQKLIQVNCLVDCRIDDSIVAIG